MARHDERPAPAPPLVARYRGVICDLDGVVYRGAEAVPGAVEALNTLTGSDVPVVFATNNAARPPGEVGDHLTALGVRQPGWSVVTSSQAAAAHLAERLGPGASVLAVGGPGLALALDEAGLNPVDVAGLASTRVDAVVQGLGVDVTWSDLAEVAYLVQRGVPWVATNTDLTIPTSRGYAPGNGTLVAAVQSTTGARPEVTGKPGPALFDLARSRLGTQPSDTVVVGDRLDTDIAGASAAGLDSVLVLSGACRLRDVVLAPPQLRPTHVAPDLAALLQPSSPVQAVVTAAWAAIDSGSTPPEDDGHWQRLEHELGLRP